MAPFIKQLEEARVARNIAKAVAFEQAHLAIAAQAAERMHGRLSTKLSSRWRDFVKGPDGVIGIRAEVGTLTHISFHTHAHGH
jgi:hypothetical protein